MTNVSRADATTPARSAWAVTPSNTEFEYASRMLTLGTSGVLSFRGVDGVAYTTGTLPAGSYAVAAIAVLPATTASNITAWG